jgi:large subunit ribosomal protein L31
MKKDTHPGYQEVVFEDSSTGHRFVCGTTLQPKEKITFEGKEYPLYRLSISSSSHPFYTKSKQFVDAEGRVDKFNKRYAAKEAVLKGPAKPVKEEKAKKGKAKK